MNRTVPVIMVIGLLVLGGFWLSQRSDTQGSVSAQAAQTEDAENQDSETQDAETQDAETQDADTQDAESEDAEAVQTEGDEASAEPPSIPEGFSATPFLSEEPVQSFTEAEEVLEPGTDYGALIQTNKGTIQVDLFEDQAPITVNNFVFLARNHYYDGIVFHRVLEGFMAQTGDPTGTGTGGPGYEFEDEIVGDLTHDKAGTLSMANAGPGTNGSQFFITFGATPHLDGRHTVFGEVVSGEDVLDDLTRIDPQSPSAVVNAGGTLEELVSQDVNLSGDPDTEIEAYLEEKLGALPTTGQTFTVDGYTAVAGQIGEDTAYGFFPDPDKMLSVTIIERSGS